MATKDVTVLTIGNVFFVDFFMLIIPKTKPAIPIAIGSMGITKHKRIDAMPRTRETKANPLTEASGAP